MKDNNFTRDFKCPYMKRTAINTIICERSCRVVFNNTAEAVKYMDRYCDSDKGWHNCTIASTIDEYWEEVYDTERMERKTKE